MSAHQPTIHNPNQQARDEQRREEARREELEKRRLEDEMHACDSYTFYDLLKRWSQRPIPSSVFSNKHIFIFKKHPTFFQPIPIPRTQFKELYTLSSRAGNILALLRLMEQKGFECPYIHQVNYDIVEKALEKCQRIQEAIVRFRETSGMVSRLLHLLHGSYVKVLEREIDRLYGRLEGIYHIGKQAVFLQDIVKLKRAVTYRTGYVLGPDSSSERVSVPKKKVARK